MGVLFLDFETKSECDIRKCGADVYARHPSTDILCMGLAWNDGPVSLWVPGQILPFDPHQNVTTVAHNAAFELAIWNHIGVKKYGFANLSSEKVVCTMAMAYAMALPGSLADAAPAAGLSLQKDTQGHRVMLSLSKPKSDGSFHDPLEEPEKFQKLYEYCKQDIEVERALYKRLLQLSPSERAIWTLDQKINSRGVSVDIKAAKSALRLVEAEKARFNSEIQKITGNAVATYNAQGQFVDWIRSRGVEVEGIAKSDVADLLKDETLPKDVREALELRREAAKSSTAKLEKMLSARCEDGRIRGLHQYHGATTGRWAGRLVQTQNFPRSKLPQSQIEDVFRILEEIA